MPRQLRQDRLGEDSIKEYIVCTIASVTFRSERVKCLLTIIS